MDPDDPVGLRVDVGAGEVGHEDGDRFGTPVVDAAPLCAAAPPGQTWSTSLVRAPVDVVAVDPHAELDVRACEAESPAVAFVGAA